jgi:predicted nucleic acid-binding protein
MKFVLDASVAMKWALPEQGAEDASRLLAAIDGGVHVALAPDILPVEVAHALLKAERRKLVESFDVDDLLAKILRAPIELHGSARLLFDAVELARRARIGVYDCLYVALAEAENCEFITADERLARSLPASPIRLLNDFGS